MKRILLLFSIVLFTSCDNSDDENICDYDYNADGVIDIYDCVDYNAKSVNYE